MKARIFPFLALAALAAALFLSAAAGASQQFTGLVTDNMCPKGDHSAMQMGPTNAECVKACVRVHGALYVLYDGKQTYTLSDQEAPEKFAGQKVTVTGTLDSKSGTIQVQSIAPAK
jgi:Protein of unknown function (DUF5818)